MSAEASAAPPVTVVVAALDAEATLGGSDAMTLLALAVGSIGWRSLPL